MKTELLEATDDTIAKAAKLLKNDEVVAFPTETVYGLGANALHPNAVDKIFVAKERPNDNPLIVHISGEEMLDELVSEIPDVARELFVFWPGPLTLVMKKKEIVPDVTSAGLPTVGIRMPAHPVFTKLIDMCGFPIAAPSANSFGKPSPTVASHVYDDMNEKIPMILDGGQCSVGIESTILDVTSEVPVLLRPGKITVEEIEAVVGHIIVHDAVLDPTKKIVGAVPSPGMKYKHYSPEAEVILVMDDSKTKELVEEFHKSEKDIGLITHKKEHMSLAKNVFVSTNVMHDLYYFLRELDKCSDIIIVEGVSNDEYGLLNRLKKAASQIVE